MTLDPIQAFIDRWSTSGGAERSNYQLFLTELCDILEVPGPNPSVPDNDENSYVFERSVTFINPDGPPSTKFIDLYKRACLFTMFAGCHCWLVQQCLPALVLRPEIADQLR